MKRLMRAVVMLIALAAGGAVTAKAAIKPWAIDEIMGKQDAPITVIEYSSLTCPHCADFHIKTFPEIKSEWIDTGKVKLIFRDFPLDPLAQAAAMIAHCSGDRYFAFINAFFHSQDQWARSSNPLAALKLIAKLGGMDEVEVDKCLDNRGLLNEINARKEDGQAKYNIDSTPSFIIGDKLYAGEMSAEKFSKIISEQTK